MVRALFSAAPSTVLNARITRQCVVRPASASAPPPSFHAVSLDSAAGRRAAGSQTPVRPTRSAAALRDRPDRPIPAGEQARSSGRDAEDNGQPISAAARREEQGLALALRPLDRAPLLQAVADIVRPLARRSGHIAVSVDVEPGCPFVSADPLRLRQVLLNLLHNALRHTPQGGIVRLAARQSHEEVIVSVADTGSGLPPDMHEQLFDRYHVTSDPERGGGLGLALVRQLVEALGGRLWVASASTEGTEIAFSLPMAARLASAPPKDR